MSVEILNYDYQALELSHRLSTSKIPVVASTASATLRQLFMFVFERVGDEDALVITASASEDPSILASLPPPTFKVDIPPPERDVAASPNPDVTIEQTSGSTSPTSIALRPAARDAYLLLEDLCLLVAGSGDTKEGEPSFLRWGTLSRTFGLELVESIISGFGTVVRSVCIFSWPHPSAIFFDLIPVMMLTASRTITRFKSSSLSTSHSIPLSASSSQFIPHILIPSYTEAHSSCFPTAKTIL
jgi:hypothetical protein